ncbi:MAG TPA: hypothetical protein ENN80_05715, partial [Candidatus Hydrogenedentes bacterium]|nr:hypothetical protein [Candidatus Hydrogenedentota bacterium]
SGKRHWAPGDGWPTGLYERLGVGDLPHKSPADIAYLGEPVDHLRPEAADALGLSPTCLVGHGGMDGWTAYVGKNCFAANTASLTLGTSTVVIAETTSPACIDGIMGPFPDGIRRAFGVYEAGQTSGGSILAWYIDMLGTGPDAHEHLAREAAAIAPGSDGLIVFDAWRGNRTPYFDPLARGTICGVTLEHGRAHIYRALLEGCAYGVRNVLDTLEAGGCPLDELRVCGSGSANDLYVDILASVTGKSLLLSHEKDATCLGSAMCAAVAAAFHPDLPTAASAMAPAFTPHEPGPEAETYACYFQHYLRTYEQMRETMHRLASLSEDTARESC